MKKLIHISVILAFLLVLMPAAVFAAAEGAIVIELIADGGSPETAVDVGEVQVWNDGENLYVRYVIDAELNPDNVVPTLIYETHLEVASTLDGVPQTKKGNPIPGQFTYSDIFDPGVTEFEYVIPMTWSAENELTIAAHAVVEELGGLENLGLALPDTVTLKVAYPGGDSYFNAIITNGGELDGTYDSWCVDVGHTIAPGAIYDNVGVFSSYEDLPAGTTIDKPLNLPLVNYVINNYTAGVDGYTMCDIQRAIWTLIDDSLTGCGGYTQANVNAIVADAVANGTEFVPTCGDQVAVVLVNLGNVQVTIQVITIGIDLPCETLSETAWGDGANFDGKQWGMYFTYLLQ